MHFWKLSRIDLDRHREGLMPAAELDISTLNEQQESTESGQMFARFRSSLQRAREQ